MSEQAQPAPEPWYQVLGLEPTARPQEIRRRTRALLRTLDPKERPELSYDQRRLEAVALRQAQEDGLSGGPTPPPNPDDDEPEYRAPCPFCGHTDVLVTMLSREMPTGAWYAKCRHYACLAHPQTEFVLSRAEALQAWNLRP